MVTVMWFAWVNTLTRFSVKNNVIGKVPIVQSKEQKARRRDITARPSKHGRQPEGAIQLSGLSHLTLRPLLSSLCCFHHFYCPWKLSEIVNFSCYPMSVAVEKSNSPEIKESNFLAFDTSELLISESSMTKKVELESTTKSGTGDLHMVGKFNGYLFCEE